MFIKLLRNNGPFYANHEDAINELSAKLLTCEDGTPGVATYSAGEGENTKTLSIFGIARTYGDQKSCTIFENADEFKAAIDTAIESLVFEDTKTPGQVVVAVSQENGKVSTTKQTLAVNVTDTTEGMQKTYDVTIGEYSVGKIDIPFCDAVLANATLSDMNATINNTTGAVTDGDPKDNDALVMVFKKCDGTYVGVKVDISTILVQSEFKNGLAVSDNGEVSVKLNDNDNYLKFGEAAEGVNAPVTANVVTLAEATVGEGETPKVTGLADALDVKTVIEENEKVAAAAFNEINVRIGDVEELTTTDKVVVDAINELKGTIDTNATTVLERVNSGVAISVSDKANKQQTINLVLSEATDNALSIENDGLYLSQCIDCGTY